MGLHEAYAAYQYSSDFAQYLSLLDTGACAYFLETAQLISHLVSGHNGQFTNQDFNNTVHLSRKLLTRSYSWLSSMTLRNRDGNLHRASIGTTSVYTSLIFDLQLWSKAILFPFINLYQKFCSTWNHCLIWRCCHTVSHWSEWSPISVCPD